MLEYSTGFKPPRQRRRLPGPIRQSFAGMVWALVSLLLLVGLGVEVGYGLTPILGWLSPLATLLLMLVFSVLVSGMRTTWNFSLLNHLEQAVRLNLPLPMMLRAAEESEGGRVRLRLARLRRCLANGESIEDSLTRSASGLPRRVLAHVGAAERSGCLALGLSRVLQEERRRSWPTASRSILMQWYPLIMVTALAGSTSIITLFVMPKYQQILHDFHIPMPPITQWVFGNWSDLVPWVALLVLAIVLVYCGQALSRTFSPRWTGPGLLSFITDPVVWHLPVIGRCVQGRGMADVCHVLADALEAGATLEHALAEASALPANRMLKQRLLNWDDRLQSGVPMAEAAREARLPDLLAGMLATAHGEGDAVRALRFLAAYYENLFSRAAELVQATLLPAMALFFGTLVAAMVLGLFMPIVELIEHLSAIKVGM